MTASAKHRVTGFDPEWLKIPQFKSWLYDTQHGMFCRLCRQHKPAARKGPGKRAFVEFGGGVYRKDYLERHITTEHHQESVRCKASLASGISVMNAFEPTVEHEAVIGGFKCFYWLIKNKLARHTNCPKLLSLAELLGCDFFRKLKIDQGKNYRSHRIIDEMLEILGEVIEDPVLSEIQSSKAITLEVDESTDVSTARQLDVHVRYLDKEGHVFNQFLDLVEIADGKADAIVTAIKTAIWCVNGVVKQLADSYPKIVGVACAAHRLALACKDSSNDVKYMATFRNHLQELQFFFCNSANRTATLKAASITLGVSDLKIKVIHPYLSGLEKNLHLRFHDLDILGAFSVFGPKSAALQDDSANIANLKILARKSCPEQENEVLQEWTSFKNHVLTGAFKDKNQADILTLLASEFDEWDNIYPCLSLLAGIALVIPVSSMNCENRP
ncbi:hypothetical protein ABVT39_020024 [Epinephelus coioides]